MAQIEKRTRKDGSISYVAKIAIRKNGQWAHREARTFDRLPAAKHWHAKRMKEITAAGPDLTAVKSKGKTLSAAIDLYITESVKEIGRTKAQVLRSVREQVSLLWNEVGWLLKEPRKLLAHIRLLH
jgi:hypothetical protein